jgi:hypothetical protein
LRNITVKTLTVAELRIDCHHRSAFKPVPVAAVRSKISPRILGDNLNLGRRQVFQDCNLNIGDQRMKVRGACSELSLWEMLQDRLFAVDDVYTVNQKREEAFEKKYFEQWS